MKRINLLVSFFIHFLPSFTPHANIRGGKLPPPTHLLAGKICSRAAAKTHQLNKNPVRVSRNPLWTGIELKHQVRVSVEKMPELNWKHHTLIQSLLSRGPLMEEEFHSIFAGVIGKNPGTSNKQLFNDSLLRINKELAFLQFELRGCRNQYDGKVYYGVVNNVADEQSKLGTKYSVPQIAFYKGIIEAIVQDGTAKGSITHMDALNIRLENQVQPGTGSQSQGDTSYIPSAFKNFTISQKEKTLDELVQDRWLCCISDGNIGLGVRSFLDLRSWFRSNDILSCDICNEAGVKAELCPNESCNVRIHYYCLKKKFSQRRVERVCPVCSTEWPFVVSKVEALEENEEADNPDEPSERQPASSSRSARKRRKSCKTEETDTVGEDPRSSIPAPELRRTTRRSARLR